MPIDFVMPLTVKPSDIRRIIQYWSESGDQRNPFARVLITPCFAPPLSVRLVRDELKEKRGSEVFFDSGGYYVQQGRIAYRELYQLLLDYYRNNQWADWYVLPDHVPVSTDDPNAVRQKVADTITTARIFYGDMPSSVRHRAVPVVQGHNMEHLQWALDTYSEFDIRRLGFGSFSTTGALNSINFISSRSEGMVRWISSWARDRNKSVHVFGISGPDVYALKGLIHTCDSMNWYKAANFGKVFFPYVRAFSVTNGSAKLRGISEDEFLRLKGVTGHDCYFCQDFGELVNSYWYRRMHNLACVLDAFEMLNNGEDERIRQIFNNGSINGSIYRRKYAGSSSNGFW